MRTVYLTDGTPEGFYTAVFDGYADPNAYLSSEKKLQTRLGDVVIAVAADARKAARVVRKLRRTDYLALRDIDRILRAPDPDREQTAFGYIRLLVKQSGAVRGMLSEDVVRRAQDISQAVGYEVHRLTGFLRFHETASGAYYSPCSPDNDIVDLLMPHFIKRFVGTPFVIHDVKRKLAGVYDGKIWLVAPAGKAEVLFSEREDAFLSLWKQYYKTTYIPARKNTKQMDRYMPVRYRKFMTEIE